MSLFSVAAERDLVTTEFIIYYEAESWSMEPCNVYSRIPVRYSQGPL